MLVVMVVMLVVLGPQKGLLSHARPSIAHEVQGRNSGARYRGILPPVSRGRSWQVRSVTMPLIVVVDEVVAMFFVC